MAISNLKSDFLSLINREVERGTYLRKKSGTQDYHQIEITADQTAPALQKGTQRVLLIAGYSRDEVRAINQAQGGNNIAAWQAVIARLFTQFTSGATIKKYGFPLIEITKLQGKENSLRGRGVYILPTGAAGSNSRRLKIRLFNVKKGAKTDSNVDDVTLNGFASAFRQAAWDEWLKNLPQELREGNTRINKLKEYGRGATQGFGLRTPFVHESGSAVGTKVLENINTEVLYNKDTLPEMNLLGVPVIYEDVVGKLISELQLDFTEHAIPDSDGNTIKYARFIKGQIGGINFAGSEPGDIRQIKNKLMYYLAKYLEDHAKDFGFDESTGLDYELSKPIRRQLQENAVNKAIKGVKKGAGKNTKTKRTKVKSKAKPVKRNTRKGNFKNTKKVSTRRGSAGLTAAATATKRKEQQKQQKTDGLLKLRAVIQKRLPAEVRRNMGRPALINRTGEFSNSVDLVSLRHTTAGISGEYTYKLNPYATFENLGQRQWPTGYNPKRLIAKSIRQLAMQYTEEKLVSLRRI